MAARAAAARVRSKAHRVGRRFRTTSPSALSPQVVPNVPASLRRELRGLMNQQCWCWGCDVRRPQGNLLIASGAVRVPVPGGDRRRSTAYHVRGPHGWIALWGFGLAVVPPMGRAVFIPRHEASPRLIVGDAGSLERSWSPMDLPAHERADTLPAWWSALSAFRWVASYESWIGATVDAGWRDECIRRFEASVVSGAALPAAWDDLTHRLETTLVEASVCVATGPQRGLTVSATSRETAGTGFD